MPHNGKVKISLNLLKPQSSPEKLAVKATKWLLSVGRYIVVVVEIVVLAAFFARFKLDSDLASTKEAIDQQIPFIESLAADERLVRQTQLQLATIKQVRQSSGDYVIVLQRIASQTPQNVVLETINLEKDVTKINVRITGQSQDNPSLAIFVQGLKTVAGIKDANLDNIELQDGILKFTITGTVDVGNATNKQS